MQCPGGTEARDLNEGTMIEDIHIDARRMAVAAGKASELMKTLGHKDRLMVLCHLISGEKSVGELAGLTVADFALQAGELRFFRPKVDKVQTHKLSGDTLEAARAYLAHDAPAIGPVMRASRKGGQLAGAGMSERNLSERVRVLGAVVGLDGLSAHDLRHHWATQAARAGTALDRLQDAGGWSSPVSSSSSSVPAHGPATCWKMS